MSSKIVQDQGQAQDQNQNRGKKRKFGSLLINPKYQLRQIFFIATSSILIVGAYSVIVYHYVRENYDVLIELSPMSPDVKAQLYKELHQLFFFAVIASLVFIFAASLIGLVLSHRTAGALYHFGRIFTEIKKGNLNARVHLRTKDDFKEIAQTFNEMMDTLQEKK